MPPTSNARGLVSPPQRRGGCRSVSQRDPLSLWFQPLANCGCTIRYTNTLRS